MHTNVRTLLWLSASLLPLSVAGQPVTVNGSMTPTQLVQNVLVGAGVTVSNVTFTGYANAIGEFNAPGATNLGFSSGVYLTTGSILQNDPNNAFSSGQDGPAGPSSNFQSFNQDYTFVGNNGDADLTAMLQAITNDPFQVTNDAAVLEFDFIPTSDSISFRYRFGSEEYNDFVSQGGAGGVNDVFAFWLTGVTTPLAQTNIALLPGGSTPVSIFTVNNGYSFGASSGPCMNCAYYVDNVNGGIDVAYDGLTTILTAKAQVICGETYHIKIAIADASDNAYDSGVFLEAGSFSSSGGLVLSSAVQFGNNDTTLIEGCAGAVIGFKRLGSTTSAQTVNYTVGGTATMGTDFPNMSGTVTFGVGIDSIAVPISALLDGVTDPNETVVISVTTTNACGQTFTQSITLYISEAPPITLDAGADVTINCQDMGNPITFTASASGGVAPLSYQWTGGPATNTFTVTPAANGVYYVSVSDACSTMVAVDSVVVNVVGANPMSITASNDTTICQGQVASLSSVVQGGNGGLTYTWSNGATTSYTSVAPSVTTTYTVTVLDLCGVSASDQVTVNVSPVDASFNYQFTTVDGEVQFNDLSAGNIASYLWRFDDGGTSTDASPLHTYLDPGTYTVTLFVTNDAGCVDSASVNIKITVNAYVFIPNSFTPNIDGLNEFFTIYGKGFTAMEMRIYDRWGEEIFFTNKPDLGWNGYDDASQGLHPGGVYAYRIDIIDIDGLPQTYRGHVNLIR